jgi:hypothetical protein
MDVKIDLDRDTCSCLMDNISVGSTLRRVFEPPRLVNFNSAGGLPLAGNARIACSEQEPVELFTLAKQHCPGAVYAIGEAARLAGGSHHCFLLVAFCK